MKKLQFLHGNMRWEKTAGIMTSILVVVLLFLRIGTVYKVGVDSDLASAVRHAQEILRTQSLFPDSWHGSTGFQIFDFLTVLPSLVTSDWTRIHMLAGFLYTAFFILALWCFTSKGLRNNSVLPYLLIVFCSPISFWWEMAFFKAFYYTHHIIFILVALAMFFAFMRGAEGSGSFAGKRLYILSAVLFFSTLFGGLRVAQQIVIPFAASIFILFLYDNKKRGPFLMSPCVSHFGLPGGWRSSCLRPAELERFSQRKS